MRRGSLSACDPRHENYSFNVLRMKFKEFSEIEDN